MTFKEFKDRLAGELGVALPDAEFAMTGSMRNVATAVDGCVLQHLIREVFYLHSYGNDTDRLLCMLVNYAVMTEDASVSDLPAFVAGFKATPEWRTWCVGRL